MTTCFLAPDPVQSTFFIPGGNTPGNGVLVFFYVSGSSTKQTVYKDPAAAVAWTNPIVLDSGGNLPLGGEVWFPQGQTFTVKWCPSNDSDPPTSPYRTMDNLAGMNDSSGTVTEWLSGPTPTFVSGTVFTVSGDQTTTFTVSRRIRTTNTSGTVYGTIITSAFGGGLTTVTVVNDSGAMDAGLSLVAYGILDPAHPSIDSFFIDRKASTVASAGSGTTNIWAIVGNYVHVTGTNTIFNFSTAPYAGASMEITFDGSLSLMSSAALSLPLNLNITTTANDRIRIRAETVSTAVLMNYFPLPQQSSGTFYAGPASGAPATPTFRAFTGVESGISLIATRTVVNTTWVAFGTSDIADWSTFNEYEFHLINLRPQLNTDGLFAQISENGGSTFISTGSYPFASMGIDGVTSNANAAGTITGMNLMASGVSNQGQLASSSYSASGLVRVYDPSTVGNFKLFMSDVIYEDQLTRVVRHAGVSQYNGDTGAINGIRFFYAAGNVSTGTFKMYGLRKT